jgi:hypothetical protein
MSLQEMDVRALGELGLLLLTGNALGDFAGRPTFGRWDEDEKPQLIESLRELLVETAWPTPGNLRGAREFDAAVAELQSIGHQPNQEWQDLSVRYATTLERPSGEVGYWVRPWQKAPTRFDLKSTDRRSLGSVVSSADHGSWSLVGTTAGAVGVYRWSEDSLRVLFQTAAPSAVNAVAMGPDGLLFAATARGRIYRGRISGDWTPIASCGEISHLECGPSAQTLVSLDNTGCVRSYLILGGKVKECRRLDMSTIRSIALREDGRTVELGLLDGRRAAWDSVEGHLFGIWEHEAVAS